MSSSDDDSTASQISQSALSDHGVRSAIEFSIAKFFEMFASNRVFDDDDFQFNINHPGPLSSEEQRLLVMANKKYQALLDVVKAKELLIFPEIRKRKGYDVLVWHFRQAAGREPTPFQFYVRSSPGDAAISPITSLTDWLTLLTPDKAQIKEEFKEQIWMVYGWIVQRSVEVPAAAASAAEDTATPANRRPSDRRRRRYLAFECTHATDVPKCWLQGYTALLSLGEVLPPAVTVSLPPTAAGAAASTASASCEHDLEFSGTLACGCIRVICVKCCQEPPDGTAFAAHGHPPRAYRRCTCQSTLGTPQGRPQVPKLPTLRTLTAAAEVHLSAPSPTAVAIPLSEGAAALDAPSDSDAESMAAVSESPTEIAAATPPPPILAAAAADSDVSHPPPWDLTLPLSDFVLVAIAKDGGFTSKSEDAPPKSVQHWAGLGGPVPGRLPPGIPSLPWVASVTETFVKKAAAYAQEAGRPWQPDDASKRDRSERLSESFPLPKNLLKRWTGPGTAGSAVAAALDDVLRGMTSEGCASFESMAIKEVRFLRWLRSSGETLPHNDRRRNAKCSNRVLTIRVLLSLSPGLEVGATWGPSRRDFTLRRPGDCIAYWNCALGSAYWGDNPRAVHENWIRPGLTLSSTSSPDGPTPDSLGYALECWIFMDRTMSLRRVPSPGFGSFLLRGLPFSAPALWSDNTAPWPSLLAPTTALGLLDEILRAPERLSRRATSGPIDCIIVSCLLSPPRGESGGKSAAGSAQAQKVVITFDYRTSDDPAVFVAPKMQLRPGSLVISITKVVDVFERKVGDAAQDTDDESAAADLSADSETAPDVITPQAPPPPSSRSRGRTSTRRTAAKPSTARSRARQAPALSPPRDLMSEFVEPDIVDVDQPPPPQRRRLTAPISAPTSRPSHGEAPQPTIILNMPSERREAPAPPPPQQDPWAVAHQAQQSQFSMWSHLMAQQHAASMQKKLVKKVKSRDAAQLLQGGMFPSLLTGLPQVPSAFSNSSPFLGGPRMIQ